MEQITFEWGKATFTVKPANIQMAMQRDQFIANVMDATTDTTPTELYYYGKLCTQVIIDGELSWTVPPHGTTGKEIADSFDYFRKMPESLLRSLIKAFETADAPYVSAEFAPFADLEALDPKD